jgi:hypothetical protein
VSHSTGASVTGASVAGASVTGASVAGASVISSSPSDSVLSCQTGSTAHSPLGSNRMEGEGLDARTFLDICIQYWVIPYTKKLLLYEHCWFHSTSGGT